MDLSLFNTTSLYEAATNLFSQLNIQLNSNTTQSLPAREVLKGYYRETEIFDSIRNTYFIGIVDESIFREVGLFDERYSYKQALEQADSNYDGLMLFALELDKHPTRTEISDLTRSFNRISQKMPVGLLLKYENGDEAVISIAISERFKYKQNWRQGEKAGKVIILRDIFSKNTHAGHVRILRDLTKPVAVTNYAQLHAHWLEVLDVSILNKRFFQELANWYFWAMDMVSFPDDVEKDKELRNATNMIRLITRIIFIWFIKEKKLVPNILFRKESLKNIVVDFMKNNKSENFYHAILQNLFFGTLNQVIEERGFVKEGTFQENRAEYGVKNLFRYADKFLISEADIIELFKEIPFLNGGLFDCLDKPDDEGKIIYVDGFSRNPKKQSHIPDYIFFTTENEVDLNEIYGTRNKRYKVQGLINLLESYKFTVAENTPVEEEIALDPELLGKVFENLLASYNPETKTTARKQTGSFYTPREIVNFMVDESLIEDLKENCGKGKEDYETRLRELFSYSEDYNPFDEEETIQIIESLNNCKILDPACGSGAFPMGILHKMVHLLTKLDSGNKLWKELQKNKAIEATEAAYNIDDHDERKQRLDEIDDVFENNTSDYGRKLYLIENCIYGIDIQPIAVQIAKLRFFISLIIDQNKNDDKENFGIRSLPNLETKFVAANTLISLDKPQQILIRNIKIIEKEEELKELRHNYFTAKTRKEKLQYQLLDKRLRKEISRMLELDGWNTNVAEKIVAFDPYDQNHSSPFFEIEWMFGLSKGFDIIIGNPPYGVSIKGDYRKKVLKSIGKVPDYEIYYYFVEIAYKLLKNNGIKSFIIPNTFLFNVFAAEYRIKLLDNWSINLIVDCTEFKLFEGATVYNAITVFKKESESQEIGFKNTTQAESITDLLMRETQYIDKKDILENNQNWALVFKLDKKTIQLVQKIKKNNKPLCEYFPDSSQGLIAYDKYQGQSKDIIEGRVYHYHSFSKNSLKKWLWGEDVNRFSLKWNGEEYIDYCEGLANPRQPKYFIGERLLIREITNPSIFSVVTCDEYYHDPAIIVILEGEGISINALCGILNSKLLSFYHFNSSPKATKGAFPKILVEDLKNFPLPHLSLTQEKSISSIVKEIHALKAKDHSLDTTNLEIGIDEIVYKIYNLTDEEIKFVEES